MTSSPIPSSRLDGGRACLLLTGAPGAGKSTVARSVARALSRSALVEGDAVARLVVSGYVWPLGDPPDEAARQVGLCNDNICSLAVNFMSAGFTPVIDWIVPDADQLEVYRAALGSRLRLVVLDPGTASMWAGFGHRGWWLDSSAQDADTTARLVLDGGCTHGSC